MGKLVRDRIPEIMRAKELDPETRVLGMDEYWAALLDKLDEEAGELREASPEDRLEEAADVYEVLTAITSAIGFSVAELQEAADLKREARGGFEERIWLDRW